MADALAYPKSKRVEGVDAENASPGHLTLESLRVYRSQDKGHIFLLDEVVGRNTLRALFGRLDHGGTLRRRYQTLTGKTP